MLAWLGLCRSLIMYYGVPFRQKKMKTLYAEFIRPGDLCFDIGSHVGNRMVAWRRLDATVVGVEPQPLFMRFLQSVFGQNPHIHLRQQAIAAKPGTLQLFISPRHPTVTTLSQKWIQEVQQDDGFSKVTWNTPVDVPVTTLDALIEEFGLPSFCKIDVEGFELEVLRGLSCPIPAVSFEYLPAVLSMAYACIDQLQTLGNYQYNLSIGETHRLKHDEWLSADEMKQLLAQYAHNGRSGDIYARHIL